MEKAALLLLTVTLSGLLAPYVIGSLQDRRAKSEAIAQAQTRLFEEASETILTYETLALDVTWFKTQAVLDDDFHQKAFERYSKRVPLLVARWRVQAARARVLASPTVGRQLDALLRRIFDEQDTPINRLHKARASTDDWERQHQKNVDLATEANVIVGALAEDLGLTPGHAPGRER